MPSEQRSLVIWISIDGNQWHAAGPHDLSRAGEGATLIVRGEADKHHGYARWAPAIGSAVLRGAQVRRV